MIRTGGLVLLAVLAWSPARAWTGSVSWPTFYYEGPSLQYNVIDELQRGQRLDVLACNDSWCRVALEEKVGYVDRDAIQPVGQAAPLPQAIPDLCFDARTFGYAKGEVWRYCPEKPPAG